MRAPGAAVSTRAHHRLAAFGLHIDCDWTLPASAPVAAGPQGGPRTSVRLLSAEQIDEHWSAPAERIFEPTYPDGRSRFTVDRTSDHYRLQFDGFGRHLVAADGSMVGCELTGTPRERQERFLFAQALPLASALQGFELLHASAVCVGSSVVAFVGPSGIGKTWLASRLVRRGAGFVTDDVLAIEDRAGGPLAQPGPGFMAIPTDDRVLIETGAGALGRVIGTSDKVHASPTPPAAPMPLRALLHLLPGEAFELAPLEGEDVARRILASAFAPYLVTRDRLRRHLETAQLLGAAVPQFRLCLPRTGSSTANVERLEGRLRELTG
jgi:hypothetical protein